MILSETPLNQPIELRDDQILVSRADLAGRIVYANADFVEISGYSEAEHIGQPHNILRHPDMPAAVFADLWNDISSGRPWVGVVKSRSKNGNPYWVEAHVSPIQENGAITGYLSMRRKASASQIAKAEVTYAAMRELKTNQFVFKHGAARPVGIKARFLTLFNDAPIGLKLILSSLSVALIVISILAIFLAKHVSEVLDLDARERLKHDVGLVHTAFSTQIESVRNEATDHGRVFFERLHWSLGENILLTRSSLESLLTELKANQGNPTNLFLPDARMIATVLLRTEAGFERKISNLKNDSGGSVLGTILPADHPALPSLLAGKPSTGIARLFGRDYMTNYRPIISSNGSVIGATFVGIDLINNLADLKSKIRGLKVGSTGYYYVADITPGPGFGNVILHPYWEGKQLPAIISNDGKNILDEMIRQGEGELVYPWQNTEAGETSPRTKLVRFQTLKDPNWVIAGGSAVDEFTALSSRLAGFLVAGGLAMAATIYLIVLWLLRQIILRPLNTQVLPAFQAISAGNYTTALKIHDKDEISQVMQGLESLQNRLAFESGLTDALASAREQALHEAEALSQTRAQFLANMSHEIRTPMNAVIGLTYLLLKGDLGKRERDYISRIEGAGKLLLGIVNDILDFSKIDAGALHLEETGFHLDEILENLTMITHDRVHEKKLLLEYVVAPNVPQALRGDPLRLSQILINLVGNAIKFTSQGSVTIFINARDLDEERVQLDFCIQDTGIGMTPKQAAKLFQAFAQADSSVTRQYGGTGLGLVICKRLVEMMDGQIQVDSQPGVGSVFSFSVTLKKDQAEKETAGTLLHHILVVDDNDLARTVLARILQKNGHIVETRDSGEGALLALKNASQPFDFALLDLNMPGMNGVELAGHIRELYGEAIKLILVTAADINEVSENNSFAFFSATLEKPLTTAKVTETLTRLSAHEGAESSSLGTATKSLSGMRILVAEDVPTNQLIMRDLLESLGATVDIAENGRLAIEHLATHGEAIHLILMDMQMPEMGGIEATQKIRGGQLWADIPIIALTANAMDAERLNCMDAGMNGFLTKPIEPQKLISMVAQWRPKHCTDTTGPVELINPPASTAFPQLPGIDVEIGLNFMLNRPALYERILRDFHARFSGETDRILAALAANETTEASRRTHSLKGLSATIGATKLNGLTKGLEDAIQNSKSDIDRSLTDVETELSLVLESIQQGFVIQS